MLVPVVISIQEAATMSSFSDVRVVLHSQELQAQQRGVVVKVAGLPEGFSRWQWFWQCLHTRRQLLELSAEQLQDIGLSAKQAHTEALKAFWRS
jgi:uncharacterized protein YjiS (DUF1127 family)